MSGTVAEEFGGSKDVVDRQWAKRLNPAQASCLYEKGALLGSSEDPTAIP